MAECEQGIQKWKDSAGQLDYPETLALKVGVPSTYNAAIDISAAQAPPDDLIIVPSGRATSEPIFVKCGVAARLVPVGELSVSPGSDEWITRGFSPAGVLEWAWTVSTDTSGPKQLRLELQPAALSADGPLGGGAQTAEVLTAVSVQATAIDSASDWMTTQWPKLVGVVAALGLAGAALLGWKGWSLLFRLRGKDATADTADPSPLPPGSGDPARVPKSARVAKPAASRSTGASAGRKSSSRKKRGGHQ